MASNNNICDKNTNITDLHPEIMATHILTRIDPTSLASTAKASSQLHAICNNEMVWTELCNSTWHSTKHQLVRKAISSFPAGHRSFFSDSFPLLHFSKDNKYWHYKTHYTTPVLISEQLISAVDIQYKTKKVYTKVDVINTSSEFLASSSFKVEVLDQKESLRLPMKCDDDEDINFADLKENLTLSWIVIDPTQKRAANISSQLPVSVRRHWIDGDIEVKYAIVMPYAGMSEMVEIRITVMLVWEEGKKYLKLRKVKLQVHDMDGVCLGGEESLRILQQAIHCGKRKKAKRGEVTEMYKKYVEKKRSRREGRPKGRQIQLTAAFITGFVVALIILMILKVGILW